MAPKVNTSKPKVIKAAPRSAEIELMDMVTDTEADLNTALSELKRLRAENDALKAKSAARSEGTLTLRVSTKGALSVYGLGRWPVTLYSGQWLRLLAIAGNIQTFLAENKSSLTEKPSAD